MTKIRRVPTQSRSREKYDKIIQTARELIGNKGNDSVSMREISKDSGVALASIYQYFPDKNAILQAIMESLFEQVRTTIIVALDNCKDISELIERVSQGVNIYYAMFKNDPVLAILWAGLQANPKLMELDTQDSIKNADIVCEKICSIIGNENKTEISDASLLLINMMGSTIRLALTLPDKEGARIIEEAKKLIVMRMRPYES